MCTHFGYDLRDTLTLVYFGVLATVLKLLAVFFDKNKRRVRLHKEWQSIFNEYVIHNNNQKRFTPFCYFLSPVV